MTSGETPAALDDIRVLDLAGETGQYCTKLLADLGADVIKVEPPSGDPVRALPPYFQDDPNTSLYWLNLNTNKRSITLDISHPQAGPLFEKLLRTADVVVESFEPGHLDALGLGYAGLSRIRPDVILTSITGFGQWGPHARYKAPDIVGVAMGGVMWLAGEPEDPPNLPPWKQGYISASIIGAAGTLVALYHRDVTGEGQHVDVSMQESLSLNQETAMQTWDMIQALRCRNGSRGIIPIDIPGIGIYECTDGHVFGYLGTPGGAPWSAMLDWMIQESEAEDLTDEPHKSFIDNLNLRFLTGLFQEPAKLGEKIQIMSHIKQVLTRFVSRRSKWEMYEGGQGRRLLWGIVSTPQDIAENPQLTHRKWLADVHHPELGATLRYPGPPYRLSETPWAIRRRPPLAGEHNAELFGELRVSEDEWRALQAAGAV
ncbi:MAG: CoA transferase [Dehalococcoidia bacterium]|nr:CoA transferase [Dehalococcoidia bacterium]